MGQGGLEGGFAVNPALVKVRGLSLGSRPLLSMFLILRRGGCLNSAVVSCAIVVVLYDLL